MYVWYCMYSMYVERIWNFCCRSCFYHGLRRGLLSVIKILLLLLLIFFPQHCEKSLITLVLQPWSLQNKVGKISLWVLCFVRSESSLTQWLMSHDSWVKMTPWAIVTHNFAFKQIFCPKFSFINTLWLFHFTFASFVMQCLIQKSQNDSFSLIFTSSGRILLQQSLLESCFSPASF